MLSMSEPSQRQLVSLTKYKRTAIRTESVADCADLSVWQPTNLRLETATRTIFICEIIQ